VTQKKITVDPKVKALIFDIDGTLADTMPAHFNAFKKVLGKYGIEFSEELFNSFAGVPIGPQMDILKELYDPKDFDSVKVASEKEEEFIKTLDDTKPIDLIYDVLKAYHGKMPIGCGTGGERKIARRTLEVIGAIDKVDAIVSCDDVVNGKPAPDTFLKCSELLGVDPQFCVVFEDGQPGIDAANAAGMMVIDVREYL
jgi:beta-phosphoglucomutase family hydrolase